MTVEHVEVLVEEPSMEAALRILLPRMLGSISFEVHPHQCKQELLVRLPSRLRGYSAWLPRGYRVVVVVDRDDETCARLKQRLDEMAAAAGLATRSSPKRGHYSVVNRIAVEELEAWYFGDWSAVCLAYPRVSEEIAQQASYRDPDAIRGGTWEAFERVMQKFGYFKSGLRKIEAARRIAAHMDPARNTSKSFQVLRHALAAMTTD